MLSNFRLTREEEKGDITGIFATRSLNARYFKSDILKNTIDNVKSVSMIKHGTVLIIKEVPQSIFIVLTVFKKAGKKYFQKTRKMHHGHLRKEVKENSNFNLLKLCKSQNQIHG